MSELLEAIYKRRPGFVVPGQHITHGDIKAALELVKDPPTFKSRYGEYLIRYRPYAADQISVPIKKLSDAVVPIAKQEVLASPYGPDGPIDDKIKAFETDFATKRYCIRFN